MKKMYKSIAWFASIPIFLTIIQVLVYRLGFEPYGFGFLYILLPGNFVPISVDIFQTFISILIYALIGFLFSLLKSFVRSAPLLYVKNIIILLALGIAYGIFYSVLNEYIFIVAITGLVVAVLFTNYITYHLEENTYQDFGVYVKKLLSNVLLELLPIVLFTIIAFSRLGEFGFYFGISVLFMAPILLGAILVISPLYFFLIGKIVERCFTRSEDKYQSAQKAMFVYLVSFGIIVVAASWLYYFFYTTNYHPTVSKQDAEIAAKIRQEISAYLPRYVPDEFLAFKPYYERYGGHGIEDIYFCHKEPARPGSGIVYGSDYLSVLQVLDDNGNAYPLSTDYRPWGDAAPLLQRYDILINGSQATYMEYGYSYSPDVFSRMIVFKKGSNLVTVLSRDACLISKEEMIKVAESL